jgi:hypothetical protein
MKPQPIAMAMGFFLPLRPTRLTSDMSDMSDMSGESKRCLCRWLAVATSGTLFARSKIV